MKSNHEDTEEYKEKMGHVPKGYLSELRALRGETSFFIECKEIIHKKLLYP